MLQPNPNSPRLNQPQLIVPKLTPENFEYHRGQILQAMQNDSVAIVFGSSGANESFVQNAQFFHLSGFEEPGAALILIKGCGAPGGCQELLVVQPRERTEQETAFFGRLPAIPELAERVGIGKVITAASIETELKELLNNAAGVSAAFSLEQKLTSQSFTDNERKILQTLESMRPDLNWTTLHDIGGDIRESRLIKTAAELELIAAACEVAASAHLNLMRSCGRGAWASDIRRFSPNEAHLHAEIEALFRASGAYHNAFVTTVAAGRNACDLHYKLNNGAIGPNDLVLVDAGAKLGGMCSDVSSTFPISGKFTPEQAAIYNMVLEVHDIALAALRPGTCIDEVDLLAKAELSKRAVALGLVSADVPLIDKTAFHRLMPHSIGHHLGLETHDAFGKDTRGPARRARLLEPGMVITIEPGCYLDPDRLADLKIPSQYLGIGVRIEDTVVITEAGHRNLTGTAPKRIADIEQIMAESRPEIDPRSWL